VLRIPQHLLEPGRDIQRIGSHIPIPEAIIGTLGNERIAFFTLPHSRAGDMELVESQPEIPNTADQQGQIDEEKPTLKHDSSPRGVSTIFEKEYANGDRGFWTQANSIVYELSQIVE
jgi:hypothetical protein